MSQIIVIAVDDSESIRKMVAFSLRQSNIKVIEAPDGPEALKILSKNRVDIIITDFDMPKMNGIQFVQKVRALPDYKKIPIIMLTTESGKAVKNQAKAAGVNAWITKPFKPVQLNDIVLKFFK